MTSRRLALWTAMLLLVVVTMKTMGASQRVASTLNRGRIAPGYYADLALFDPASVAERADFGHAQDQSVGIRSVWVNGEVVFRDGKTTAVFSGRPVRRGDR